jgi:hypothetical protein
LKSPIYLLPLITAKSNIALRAIFSTVLVKWRRGGAMIQ